jgi:hypothetical protein
VEPLAESIAELPEQIAVELTTTEGLVTLIVCDKVADVPVPLAAISEIV